MNVWNSDEVENLKYRYQYMQLGNLDENSHKQKMVGPNYPRKKSWIDQTSSEEFEHDL